MKDCILRHQKLVSFVGGVLAAAVGSKILKSQNTRRLCVIGLARGMKLQRDAQEAFQNMKEDAQDLCYDAKVEAGCETLQPEE